MQQRSAETAPAPVFGDDERGFDIPRTGLLIKFDHAAQEAFSAWHQHHERFVLRDADLSPALKGHFAKYRKLVPALALINFLADGCERTISLDALTRAIDFSRY